MITNERQYKSAIVAIRSFEDALATIDLLGLIKQGVDPVIARAQITSYEAQLDDLVSQVRTYDAQRAGLETSFSFESVRELGEHLIGCRVARSWTQKRLAEVLGVKEQQIQRYEKERYANISLTRLQVVAEALGVSVLGTMRAPEPAGEPVGVEGDFVVEPSLYPLREMNARGWLVPKLDLRRATEALKKDVLASFFSQVDLPSLAPALHRKSAGHRSPQAQAAMLAWQARILALADQRKGLSRPFSKLTSEDLNTLTSLSRRPDGVAAAVDFLLSKGVIVVFESHLPKTKLDGAAMILDGRYGVIGLSVRHDRVDNFWFVLLHELGHIMLHWGPLLRRGFVDEEVEKADDSFEREANDFARSAIVPDEAWNASFVRYSMDPTVIREFAAKWKVHEALVAGRIRFERNDYKAFADMVGAGKVRPALAEAGFSTR